MGRTKGENLLEEQQLEVVIFKDVTVETVFVQVSYLKKTKKLLQLVVSDQAISFASAVTKCLLSY